MAIRYRPYEPQQEMLLPASLQEWLRKGHLAHFIGDTVDALDLGAFYARCAGGEHQRRLAPAGRNAAVRAIPDAPGTIALHAVGHQIQRRDAFPSQGLDRIPPQSSVAHDAAMVVAGRRPGAKPPWSV